MVESWCSHQKLFTLVSLTNFRYACELKSSEKLSIRKTYEKIYNPFHEVFPHASKLVHEAYMQRMSL